MSTASLIDPFGRRIHYLRVSVTDRCDFRCRYCMSEGTRFLPRAQLLTLEENARLARIFCELGVDRIRVTGGEPLTRRNLPWLLERIGQLPALRELTLTTNGSRLASFAAELHRAGVARLNISLDTLDPQGFNQLTGGGKLADTLAGIEAAHALGFRRIKLNCVMLKGVNQDQAFDLLRFAMERDLDISFIEQMPLGAAENLEPPVNFCSSEQIRADLARHVELLPTTERSGGPSRYWRIAGSETRVGFISPRSRNFCGDCNRVRITADGRLLTCLGREQATDLRLLVRAHPGDDAPVKAGIREAIATKPRGTDFAQLADGCQPISRAMNATGG
ncbi:GTP 3',8-cyclase MoaA [Thiorhodovibrio frisius]|uniref:GTP 3',8-cyclase MoaA n=1 Tax=Thiorhodovibrio frisius TaxID=631362 RepID=UPI001CBBB968|nr:GTP 3',8-cyclase MoaA [Thiorhodovibrio frisius]